MDSDTDWPLWGDAGDLVRADPHGRRALIAARIVFCLRPTTTSIPPLDLATLDKILEPLL